MNPVRECSKCGKLPKEHPVKLNRPGLYLVTCAIYVLDDPLLAKRTYVETDRPERYYDEDISETKEGVKVISVVMCQVHGVVGKSHDCGAEKCGLSNLTGL